MNHIPAISVLMPVYNTEAYLREAFDSLVAQTFTDFEVVCINDGSTDASRAIIQEQMDVDPRFRVIDKPNSGYGASMNLGIAQARGEWIAVLEPDDFFEADALETLIAPAREHDLDVVKADYWFYWSMPEERNQAIGVVKPQWCGQVVDPLQTPEVFFAIPSIWSGLYRRAWLLERGVGFLETPGASFQDLGFTFKVWANTHHAWFVDQPILHYRQDNEASSVNDPKKAYCVCDELAEIDRIVAASPDEAALRPIVYRMKYDNYLWNFGRLSREARDDFFRVMLIDLRAGQERGDYDPALFGSWQRANLEYLLMHPTDFLKRFPATPSKWDKAFYYLRIGGPKALLGALKR